jgi:hypothetical protein
MSTTAQSAVGCLLQYFAGLCDAGMLSCCAALWRLLYHLHEQAQVANTRALTQASTMHLQDCCCVVFAALLALLALQLKLLCSILVGRCSC